MAEVEPGPADQAEAEAEGVEDESGGEIEAVADDGPAADAPTEEEEGK
jgi:hypothetical protein